MVAETMKPNVDSGAGEVQHARLRSVSRKLVLGANTVLLAGATVSVLVFLYYLFYYPLTGQRYFTSWTGAILHLGGPAVTAAVLFGLLRTPPLFRIRSALVFLSTSVSIYLVELSLFVLAHATLPSSQTLQFPPRSRHELNEIVKVAKNFGVNFDTRSTLEIINDLRNRGIDAVPAIVPLGVLKRQEAAKRNNENVTMSPGLETKENELLPLAGISKRVTVLCNELGAYLTYLSDERGFHNPPGLWKSAPLDLVAIGDSYTHGMCVPSEKNFISLIRQRYPATLNLGVAGNGPLLELATLIEYVRSLKPRIVLWFFYEGNDFLDLEVEKNFPLLRRYLEEDFMQGLPDVQIEVDAKLYIEAARQELSPQVLRAPGTDQSAINGAVLIKSAREIAVLSNLRSRLGLVYGSFRHGDQRREPSADNLILLAKVLRKAKAAVTEWGGVIYLVYLPERDRYVNAEIAEKHQRNRKRVLELAASMGYFVVDIHDVFQAHGDPLSLFPFRRFPHYNERGHALVTEAVLRSISLDPQT